MNGQRPIVAQTVMSMNVVSRLRQDAALQTNPDWRQTQVGRIPAVRLRATSWLIRAHRRREACTTGPQSPGGGAGGVRYAVLCATVPVATAMAIAGPNQDAPTPELPSTTDFLQPVRDWGSTSDTLWSDFAGDYLAWQWLNGHTDAGQRIATFEVRSFYFARPQSLFYLDGTESVPLYKAQTEAETMAILKANRIKYALMPAWSVGRGASANPATGYLPLTKYLGSTSLPLVAAFAPYSSPQLTEIYSVSDSSGSLAPAIWIGTDSSAPIHSTYVFPAHSDEGRIFVPGSGSSPQEECLTFEYRNGGHEPLSLTAPNTSPVVLPQSETWARATVAVSFPQSSGGVSTIAVKTRDSSLELRNVVSSPVAGRCGLT